MIENQTARADFRRVLIEEIDRVFAENPSFIDHRKLFPWVTAFLGNPESKTIFLAENPSLPQMKRAAAEPTMRSEETQWNVSSGDKIFRQALVGSGFKEGTIDSPGGWNCYITDVIKMAVKPGDWNSRSEEERLRVAEKFAPALQNEIGFVDPYIIVVMGKNTTRRLFDRLVALGKLRIAPKTRVEHMWHYAYFHRGGQTKEHLEKYYARFRELASELSRLQNLSALGGS